MAKSTRPQKYVVTNIRFTPSELKQLKLLALSHEKSVAELVREAVASYLATLQGKRVDPEDLRKDPFYSVIGIGESGVKDGSVNHDKYIYGPPRLKK